MSPISRLLPEGQEWFSAKEAAGIIGRSDQYVRDCFDNQKLMGHALNARGTLGKERRRSYQIPRDALILYMLETANYRPGDFAERLLELVRHLEPAERRVFREQVLALPQSVWT